MNGGREEKGEGTTPAKPSWEEIQKYEQRIRVCKNGPYQVFGGIPLSVQRIILDKDGFSSEWREEEKFPVQDQVHPLPVREIGNPTLLRRNP